MKTIKKPSERVAENTAERVLKEQTGKIKESQKNIKQNNY